MISRRKIIDSQRGALSEEGNSELIVCDVDKELRGAHRRRVARGGQSGEAKTALASVTKSKLKVASGSDLISASYISSGSSSQLDSGFMSDRRLNNQNYSSKQQLTSKVNQSQAMPARASAQQSAKFAQNNKAPQAIKNNYKSSKQQQQQQQQQQAKKNQDHAKLQEYWDEEAEINDREDEDAVAQPNDARMHHHLNNERRRQELLFNEEHEDDLEDHQMARMNCRLKHAQQDQFEHQGEGEHDDATIDYQNGHFDPYSVYGEEDNEEEDVWYSEERLFEDHIQEIIDRWLVIDDEIWAKIICMERNRRIAKAYARRHSLTINGSEDEYLDGTTLGLNSFDNPERSSKTQYIKQYIGQGLRIKITPNGDIIAKRLSKANIYVHKQAGNARNQHQQAKGSGELSNSSGSDLYTLNSETSDFYAINASSAKSLRTWSQNNKHKDGGPIDRLPMASSSSSYKSSPSQVAGASPRQMNQFSSSLGYNSVALDFGRPVKIFDMERFRAILDDETRKACPDKRRLQRLCISIASFVVDDQSMLNLPSWVMIINIVAIDLLRAEFGFHHHAHMSPFLEHKSSKQQLLDPLLDNPLFKQQQHQGNNAAVAAPATYSYHNHKHYQYRNQNRFALAKTRQAGGVMNALNNGGATTNNPLSSASSSHSSSGFDSHGSSQLVASENNSPNSSSSNINTNNNEKKHNPNMNNKEPATIGVGNGFVKATTAKLLAETNQRQLFVGAAASARDKKGTEACKAGFEGNLGSGLVSRPFPIPTPPSSPTTGPSGTANLILVSPTGLTPPLPKRKLNSVSSSIGNGKLASSSSGVSKVPHFSTIKHIDENGQCSIIVNQEMSGGALASKRLPAGIPAHAKLAPPETQKHIIRYLMSATRGGMIAQPEKHEQDECQQDATPRLDSDLRNKLNQRRPLPYLPSAYCRPPTTNHAIGDNYNAIASTRRKQPPQQSDETLYYKGLQARVVGDRNGRQFQMSKLSGKREQPMQQQQQQKHNTTILAPLQLNYLGYHEGQQPVSKPVRYFGSHFDLSKSSYNIGSNGNNCQASSKMLKLELDISSASDFARRLKSPCASNKSLSMDNLNSYQRASHKASILSHLLPFSKFKKISSSSKVKGNTNTNNSIGENHTFISP